MTESEALALMVPPGQHRPGKFRGGVIQIWTTRACDKACFNCTQASDVAGAKDYITVDNFEAALNSLRGYFGVVGVFGGNPALHPQFEELCSLVRRYVPYEQRGLWCNHPLGKGDVMRRTFNPAVSNLNVHLDQRAYDEFRRDWPEARPFGLEQDSRHSPPWVAMRDVLNKTCPECAVAGPVRIHERPDGVTVQWRALPCPACGGTGQVYDEAEAWRLISACDINQHWSAMIGQFRGQVRAWFCEIAGAQAMLHQDEPGYPDTGLDPTHLYSEKIWTDDMSPGRELPWWQLPMTAFTRQVRQHCHDCGVPLRGHGELAQADKGVPAEGAPAPKSQASQTHAHLYRPKRKGRAVELVTTTTQLGERLAKVTDYVGNARR